MATAMTTIFVEQCIECRKVRFRSNQGDSWSDWGAKLPRKVESRYSFAAELTTCGEECRKKREEFIESTHR